MQAGFDRLLELAQRSGDRLIIYDRFGHNHKVIVDLDDYEHMLLVDEREEAYEDVRQLSEGELIDKINRDIAMWRSSFYDRNFDTDDEYDDVWGMDKSMPDTWHSAEEVLQARHGSSGQPVSEWESTPALNNTDFSSETFPEEAPPSIPRVREETEPIAYDPLGEAAFGTPVPPASATTTTSGYEFEEEPLDDEEEPVFFEEPIE